jgi:polyhydroxybutyrate depolymerase
MSVRGHRAMKLTGRFIVAGLVAACGGSPAASAPPPSVAASTGAAGASGPCDVHPGSSTSVSWTVDGLSRSALVHIPMGGSGSQPMPVIVALHGYGGFGQEMELTSKLSDASDAHGWLVAYPEGTGTPESWADDPADTFGHRADMAFLRQVIGDVVRDGCGDPTRVVATGISQGGWLSDMVGCEMTDVVAAVVPVAGRDMGWGCTPKKAIPFVAVNGVLDEVLPYAGGPVDAAPPPLTKVDSVDAWLAARAKSRGCAREPNDTNVSTHVKLETWSGCRAPVSLYRVEDGGHSWPNGGGQNPPVDRELSVDKVIADLLAAM